jgi:hypothetical protein
MVVRDWIYQDNNRESLDLLFIPVIEGAELLKDSCIIREGFRDWVMKNIKDIENYYLRNNFSNNVDIFSMSAADKFDPEGRHKPF